MVGISQLREAAQVLEAQWCPRPLFHWDTPGQSTDVYRLFMDFML
jgi:hypothetical protein